MAMLQQQNKELEQKGVPPTMLLLDPGPDKLSEMVADALRGKAYDVVSVSNHHDSLLTSFFLFKIDLHQISYAGQAVVLETAYHQASVPWDVMDWNNYQQKIKTESVSS